MRPGFVVYGFSTPESGKEMHMNTTTVVAPSFNAREIAKLDPYVFFALLGKRIIHPGGRFASEELFSQANLHSDQQVLDAGCGVGTTAITIARCFGAKLTAADISPLMLHKARSNVRAANLDERVSVERADILALPYASDTFDRVIAEAVTMFVDRASAAAELVRVCRPAGMVLATEFVWRRPPSQEAREIFLGQICPGMEFDTVEDWIKIYGAAGLGDIEVKSGPFDMMTPGGFLADEGFVNSMAVMARGLSRPAYLRKMLWLMPRMAKAVPYLGYVLIRGTKTSQADSAKEETSQKPELASH